MTVLDLETWSRREHFAFFRRSELPFYNVNTRVNVSGVRDEAQRRACSLNAVLMHLTMKALLGIENFRYRVRGESVVLHDGLDLGFAHLAPDQDLFRMVVVPFHPDLVEFSRSVRHEAVVSRSYFPLEKLAGRDDLVFFSSLPWIAFTGVDHTLSLRRDDGIPRVTWGKITQDERGRSWLPFNLQVNHMFVDGLHVGRFFDALEAEVKSFAGAS